MTWKKPAKCFTPKNRIADRVVFSIRQSGATLLAFLAAACLLYLEIAAISVPGNPGSWGIEGGVIAILGGTALIRKQTPTLTLTHLLLTLVCRGVRLKQASKECISLSMNDMGRKEKGG